MNEKNSFQAPNNKDEKKDPEVTKEESKKIHPISDDTVHKICSGQVVISLAVAVKELVENSIDAGAKIIEVKLKEHGLESIEVSDNGTGVKEENFEGMTAKYHTSKLREFSDLEGIETFGFRGEALSSLCALSDMLVTTKHFTAEIGSKLELDHNGKIQKRTQCARHTGTTVILSNLFSTLPVRKREFAKNVKKEFHKMVKILQAYCIITTGVRIVCSNHTGKGSKTVFLSTNGGKTILENISAVFGSKQLTEIIEIKSSVDDTEKITSSSLHDEQDPNSSLEISEADVDHLNQAHFQINGWISSCSHGSGRSSTDRQYYYVNERPCDPKHIIKIVNEVYHRYNVQQYPFIVLNLKLNRNTVDVNLTPDKRQILLHNEKIILLAVKKSILNTFGNIPSTYTLQTSIIDSEKKGVKKLSLSEMRDSDDDDDVKIKPDSQKFMEIFSQWKVTGTTDESAKPIKLNKRKQSIDEIVAKSFKMKKIQEFLTTEPVQKDKVNLFTYKSDSESDDETASKMNESVYDVNIIKERSEEFDHITKANKQNVASSSQDIFESFKNDIPLQLQVTPSTSSCSQASADSIKFSIDFKNVDRSMVEKHDSVFDDSDVPLVSTHVDLQQDSDNETLTQKLSLDRITTTIDEIYRLSLENDELKKQKTTKAKLAKLKFKTDITPSQNKTAEEELQREITKNMFSRMEIIGQFNLGFIIVRLDTDLFIIDQHAADEKYNFEDLQKTTVLLNQPLVIPYQLELTAINEMILLDNLRIFEMNGFKFQVDENAPVTKKVKLTGKPFSKNWQFGKEDIDELIFMLQDVPLGTMCRPSRIRAMFASRACRKSVMIGTALKKATMRKLIDHMGEIDQPWNCPHGRPTMRHLINLEMLTLTKEEEK